VVLTVKFTPEEADAYKNSLRDAKRIGAEYIKGLISESNDSHKTEYLISMLQTAESEDTDSYFILQPDGTYDLNMPHRNAEVVVDGVEYSTDQEGFYEIPIQSQKQINVQLTKENTEITSVDVNLQSQDSQSTDIKIVKSFEEFARGIQQMGIDMQAEAQGITTYSQIPVGGYFGAGVGRSKVFQNRNIVGCNKHDMNLSPVNYAQFAIQNSDCSVSVRLGVMAIQNNQLQLYKNSIYCVDEAIGSEDTSAGNIYCNGTYTMRNGNSKSNRINCSYIKKLIVRVRFFRMPDPSKPGRKIKQ
jgi:hypothetical protein